MVNQCPACGASSTHIFYSLKNLPVHSVRLLWSREEALAFPTGRIDLAHCPSCGFIYNASYQPELQDYSDEYQSTQAYSPTFSAFARRLAEELIERFDLHHKEIVEIGCGQGEFLSLLCELGDNHGTGFDPAYDPARSAVSNPDQVEIIPDYYGEKYTNYKADFFCCKMTLEHIRDVAQFIGTVRRSVGNQPDTVIFFQVPDVKRILFETAFWDIYYEHCSYFGKSSLANLFRQEGFEVLDVWRDYGDQYLMISARPAEKPETQPLPPENDVNEVTHEVAEFITQYPLVENRWKKLIKEAANQGKKVVIWGSGSKGVAFLTTLHICDEIEYTVDVDPHKDGTFMAGTGQKVVAPAFLKEYQPDLIILMNPLYRREVQRDLEKMGVSANILAVGE